MTQPGLDNKNLLQTTVSHQDPHAERSRFRPRSRSRRNRKRLDTCLIPSVYSCDVNKPIGSFRAGSWVLDIITQRWMTVKLFLRFFHESALVVGIFRIYLSGGGPVPPRISCIV